MTVAELTDELVRLTEKTDEDFSKRLCGELYAYARGLKALWEDARTAKVLPGISGEKEEEE
jgi:hypothetical protein